jgi:colanic acid biosynthesis glycosyl transferase WcaI
MRRTLDEQQIGQDSAEKRFRAAVDLRGDHRRRVCFINRCYWPDTEATGQLLTELCEYLAPRWNVSAVVGQPNWKTESDHFIKSGLQMRNGVAIQRLEHLQLPKQANLGRIRNLVSFTLAVRAWGAKFGRSALSSSQRDSGSEAHSRATIVCETDPFLLPLVVGSLARRCNANLIYYLQDIYPDVAVAVGVTRNTLAIRALRYQLKRAYLNAKHIIVLDEDMRERLASWGIPKERIGIVPNWMDCSTVKPIKDGNPFRTSQSLDDRFLVMHSGNMGMTQRLSSLVDAMRMPAIPQHVTLALVGNGAKRPELEKQANGSPNIRFIDYQPREHLSESLSAADLHVVSMDQAITGCLAPSKLYGILASGTPVLAIVPRDNAVWRFVRQHRLGWVVEPGDIPGIADAISAAASEDVQSLRTMGNRARQLAIEFYDKEICCSAFETALRQIAL